MNKRSYSFLVVLIGLMVFTLAITACGGGEPALGSKDNPYVWVLVPSTEVEMVQSGAEAIAAKIEEQSGIVIEPLVAADYAEAVKAMCDQEAHLGALNTFSYLLAHNDKCADVALVSTRYGTTFYSGQVVAYVDTGITQVADLAGTTFCRPDPTSTSGWVIPSIAMRAQGLNLESDLTEIIDAGGHDGVIKAVYEGQCQAGASFVDARDLVEEEFPDVKEKVVVITESPPIPNDTISFIPAISDQDRKKLTEAFLELTQTEEGVEILGLPQNWEGLERVEDNFYNGFRQQLEAANVNIEDLAQ